jgi:hypothetical protein
MSLIILLLSVFTQNSFSQTDFCLPGARWVYYTPGSATSVLMERVFTYQGDTTIFGYSGVKKVSMEQWWATGLQGIPIGPVSYGSGIKYYRTVNDSVMEFFDGDWEFRFDFNVDVGDSRTVFLESNDCMPHDTIFVESIDTISFQGLDLERVHYQLLVQDQYDTTDIGYMPTFNGSYTDRIGVWTESPTGGYFSCVGLAIDENMPLNLTCYTDSEIITNGGEACDLILGVSVLAEELPFKASFLHDYLQIQSASNSTLRVYDILGKQLFQERVISDNESFDISHVSAGILMVVIESETGRFIKKVIKTSLN